MDESVEFLGCVTNSQCFASFVSPVGLLLLAADAAVWAERRSILATADPIHPRRVSTSSHSKFEKL